MLLRAWANFSDCGFSRTTPTKKKNLQVTITLVKLTQVHCFTSSGKNCMIRPSVQHSPTLTHSNLMQSPLLSNTVWSMPNVTFKEQEQVLKYRTDMMPTDKHTKRFSHTTGPATCPLSGGSDIAPHILLRCNNHTLKRMHINRHHHAVLLCTFVVKRSVEASWLRNCYNGCL